MTTLASPRISYDELGSGGPALLFLPGWCGGREVCSPICCPRVAQSRRAVALDWRGHGQSERSDSDFGTAELVADALGVIDRLGLGADRSRRAVTPAGSPSSCGAASARRACPASRSSTGWCLDRHRASYALAELQLPEAWEAVRAGLFDMWTTGMDVPALQEYVASMGTYGFDCWSRAGREIAAAFAAHPVPLEALAELEPPARRSTCTPSRATTVCWPPSGSTPRPTRGLRSSGSRRAATSRCSRSPPRSRRRSSGSRDGLRGDIR
jgi:hypothetical protein